MKPLFVSSTGAGAGQTMLAWHLMRLMQERGLGPGFFKPLGVADPKSGHDPDAALFKELFDLAEPLDALCPTLLEDPQERGAAFERDAFLDQVKRRFSSIEQGHRAHVVMGSSDIFVNPDVGGLPDGKFIELLDAGVVLVDRFESESNTVYNALSVASLFGGRLRAIVISRVPGPSIPALREKLSPLTRKLGEGTVALIPVDRVMEANRVDDYAGLLAGNLLTPGADVTRAVAATTIGNDKLKGPLALLKRMLNKIVLNGGTPEQLADPDFEPVPVAVLATGGRTPPDAVVTACDGEGIALIGVEMDSFGVSETMETARVAARPEHFYKIERLAGHLMGQLDPDRLLGG